MVRPIRDRRRSFWRAWQKRGGDNRLLWIRSQRHSDRSELGEDQAFVDQGAVGARRLLKNRIGRVEVSGRTPDLGRHRNEGTCYGAGTGRCACERRQMKALASLTMVASIASEEATDGQYGCEQDHVVVPLLTMVTMIHIAFFTLCALARMCRATRREQVVGAVVAGGTARQPLGIDKEKPSEHKSAVTENDSVVQSHEEMTSAAAPESGRVGGCCAPWTH